MAWETGVATNYLDLMHKLRYFVTGNRLIPNSDITYPIGQDALIDDLRINSSTVVEDITFTASDDGTSSAVIAQALTNADFATGDFTGWTTDIGAPSIDGRFANDSFVGLVQDEVQISQVKILSGINTTKMDAGDSLAVVGWDQSALSTNPETGVTVTLDFLDGAAAFISSESTRDLASDSDHQTTFTFGVRVPTLTRQIRIRLNQADNTPVEAGNGNCTAYVGNITLDIIEDELQFDITGSVTGAMGSFISGEDFDDGDFKFRFVHGSEAWVVSETVTFSVVAPTEQNWVMQETSWSKVQSFKGVGYQVGSEPRFTLRAIRSNGTSRASFSAISYIEDFDNSVSRIGQTNSSGFIFCTLWDLSMDYWFFVNDRNIKVVVELGLGHYNSFHFGHILAFATPAQHAYPMYIGGSYDTSGVDYDFPHPELRSYPDPGEDGALLFEAGGTWKTVRNHDGASGANAIDAYLTTDNKLCILPFHDSFSGVNEGAAYAVQSFEGTTDEIRLLIPLTVIIDTTDSYALGEIEDTFYVLASSHTPEEILTIDSDDYIIFPIGKRTRPNNFFAIRMVD